MIAAFSMEKSAEEIAPMPLDVTTQSSPLQAWPAFPRDV
jgi:hypothetical protein